MVVDNGSVFTKNLCDFISSNNIDFKLLSWDNIALDTLYNFDSFILSGRTSNNKQMNLLNSKIIQYCVGKSKKLFGICYGAELLALTLGGTIRKMNKLQKGNQNICIIQQSPLTASCPSSITVYQSHRYELATLGPNFISIATSSTCQHEIIQYKNYKIFGTQFHPEMTGDGHHIIANFLTL